MKVSELTGRNLDYWVAKADGLALCSEWDTTNGPGIFVGSGRFGPLVRFNPSERWDDGGSIIERERIDLDFQDDVRLGQRVVYWEAYIKRGDGSAECWSHESPLVAAMRAYVASKYGNEVPDEVAE